MLPLSVMYTQNIVVQAYGTNLLVGPADVVFSFGEPKGKFCLNLQIRIPSMNWHAKLDSHPRNINKTYPCLSSPFRLGKGANLI